MSALQITALVCTALAALGGLLWLAAWLHHLWAHRDHRRGLDRVSADLRERAHFSARAEPWNKRWIEDAIRDLDRPRRPARALTLEQTIAQLFRLTEVLQIVLCCLIGLLAGVILFLGWCADAPVWLQP